MNPQAGAVALIAAALAAAAVTVTLMAVDVGRVVAAHAQLTTAADAAALAAAPATFATFGSGAGPAAVATELAEANGARLVKCECGIDRSWAPRRVTVTVREVVRLSLLGDRELLATASAEFQPIALVDQP